MVCWYAPKILLLVLLCGASGALNSSKQSCYVCQTTMDQFYNVMKRAELSGGSVRMTQDQIEGNVCEGDFFKGYKGLMIKGCKEMAKTNSADILAIVMGKQTKGFMKPPSELRKHKHKVCLKIGACPPHTKEKRVKGKCAKCKILAKDLGNLIGLEKDPKIPKERAEMLANWFPTSVPLLHDTLAQDLMEQVTEMHEDGKFAQLIGISHKENFDVVQELCYTLYADKSDNMCSGKSKKEL